jgi:sarcosine oxidase, subunit gamma
MSSFTPSMRSPLHHFGLTGRQEPVDRRRGVWANEVPLLGYISLRGNASLPAFTAAIKTALGVDLPTQPCSA